MDPGVQLELQCMASFGQERALGLVHQNMVSGREGTVDDASTAVPWVTGMGSSSRLVSNPLDTTCTCGRPS